MYKHKKFDFILFIFKLFRIEYSKKYHSDYFNELFSKIRGLSDTDCFEMSLLELHSSYLYSSNARFNFCKEFVKYCNNFLI